MTDVFIFGIDGKMGRAVKREIDSLSDLRVSGGFARQTCDNVFNNAQSVDVPIDIVIDFSSPELTDELQTLALRKNCPVVVATTGQNKEQMDKLYALSSALPVFYSRNMSVGVSVLARLTRECARLFDSDVEIVEYHHRCKADSPSGTAEMLCESVEKERNLSEVYGRRGARGMGELGVSSVRGGTIVGRHDVIFCGEDEVITLSHSAASRKIFALGSLRAARWLIDRPKGFYTMEDILEDGV